MKKLFYFTFVAVAFMSVALNASDNLLGSSAFSKEAKWSVWAPTKMYKAGLKISYNEGVFEANVPIFEGRSHSFLQLMRTIKLENGKRYKLSFDAEVDKEDKLSVSYILNKKPYSGYGSFHAKLKKGKNHIAKEFTVGSKPEVTFTRSIRFYLGKINGKIKLSNITLQEVTQK